MTDRATDETGWSTLAAHMVVAEPRRSLWSPDEEPLTWRGYLAATLIAIGAIAAYALWSVILP